ncbi:MAG: M50 family metallopeptidase [Myxococcota bacterium]
MFGTSENQKRWKLFSIAGNDIFVTPFFLILIAFFSFMSLQAGAGAMALANIVVWAPVLFIGVLLHELGHAFAMQQFGYGASTIVLHGFGGVTINRRRQNSSPGKSIAISLAGPAASLALGLLFFGILFGLGYAPKWPGTYLAQGNIPIALVNTMAGINIFWAVFNMIPINPMDGGHVVLHALRAVFDDQRKAMRYSAISSLVLLVIAVPLGLPYTSGILLILFAAMFGYQNWQIYQATKEGTPKRRGY